MSAPLVRSAGLVASTAYAVFIVWAYVSQPRTVAQLAGGVAATVGAYRVDPMNLQEGLRFFRADQFPEARAAFARADPAGRDAVTQFYVAYSYYRQGWGRFYHDDALYREGLTVIDRAIAQSGAGRIEVSDPGLGMRTADELRAELQRGITRDVSDLNPLRAFRARQ